MPIYMVILLDSLDNGTGKVTEYRRVMEKNICL